MPGHLAQAFIWSELHTSFEIAPLSGEYLWKPNRLLLPFDTRMAVLPNPKDQDLWLDLEYRRRPA